MTRETVQLLDPAGNVIGVAQVVDDGRYYGGTIDLSQTPVGVRQLFDEFDECVNGQMFSFLDEIEDRIAALGVRGAFADGRQLVVQDLQVCPSTGDVAFKVAADPVSASAPRQDRPEALPARQPHTRGG